MFINSTFNILYRGAAVNFIGRGNRSTRRKPPTCLKLTTNFIIWYSIEYTLPWTGFELTTLAVIGIDCTGSCQSHYHMITNTTAPNHFELMIRFILHCNITKTKSLTNRRFSHSRFNGKIISFFANYFSYDGNKGICFSMNNRRHNEFDHNMSYFEDIWML